MIVPSKQCGAIIGKAGATIQAITKETGATIRVAKEAFLGTTDKSVDLKGTPESLSVAVSKVLIELESHPLKEGTSQIQYRPGNDRQMALVGNPMMGQIEYY